MELQNIIGIIGIAVGVLVVIFSKSLSALGERIIASCKAFINSRKDKRKGHIATKGRIATIIIGIITILISVVIVFFGDDIWEWVNDGIVVYDENGSIYESLP